MEHAHTDIYILLNGNSIFCTLSTQSVQYDVKDNLKKKCVPKKLSGRPRSMISDKIVSDRQKVTKISYL